MGKTINNIKTGMTGVLVFLSDFLVRLDLRAVIDIKYIKIKINILKKVPRKCDKFLICLYCTTNCSKGQ